MSIKAILKSNKGVSIIIYAISLTLLMSVAATVVDVGDVMVEHQKLQTTCDSIALAAAQELPNTQKAQDVANQYAEANGFKGTDFTIEYYDSNRTISVSGNKKVNYFFAKVLGYNDTTTYCNASASEESIGGAFDYAVFSGSTINVLTINGSSQYIYGNVHTNKSFVANGSNITITGACEAVSTITVHGSSITIGSKEPNSSLVDMPDFSDSIKAQAQAAGKAYTGNKTYSGSNINVDSSIYVNGNVTINGSHFQGKGCVLASGDITFNGSNLNSTSNDAVCFYSQTGNIYINGSNAQLNGIVYAPKGNIIFNGSNQTVKGRVVGNVVTFNGSSLQVISGQSDLDSLPSHGVKLIE